tara:strand:- start:59 stop:208 length:150 start_codon:yes stop_codon:yes gene_type:complete
MTNSINDYEIRGAFIKNKKNSKEYENNYERIFRKKEEIKKSTDKKKGRS